MASRFALTALATTLTFCLLTTNAQAQDTEDKGTVSYGIGYFDVFDDDNAIDMRLEYRSGKDLFIENLRPWIGLEATTDAAVWGGGGLLYDVPLQDNIYLTPSIGAGLYARGSSDTDLQNTIIFRSQLELAYEFTTEDRLGVALSHSSNASLGDSNPGTEVLTLYWHAPFYGPF